MTHLSRSRLIYALSILVSSFDTPCCNPSCTEYTYKDPEDGAAG